MATTLVCYLLGGLLGALVVRGHGRVLAAWPVALRVQTLLAAGAVGLFAAWRLSAPSELLGPLVIELAGVFLLGYALLSRRRSQGEAALEAWAAGANGGFWVIPMAGAVAGPAGVMVAVIADRFGALRNAVLIHLLRRDAPLPQRRSTSWVDQSPLLMLVLGLVLNVFFPAPSWSGSVLSVAAPFLAFTGAALFVGSVRHPGVQVPLALEGVRRWVVLVLVRSLVLVPLVVFSSGPLAVVAALTAFGAPPFNPPQLSILYGYRSQVVQASVRLGWLLLPLGLFLALSVS